MNDQQLVDRLRQAGATGIVNRGYQVDAIAPPDVGLKFVRDKTTPAGWWWTFEVGRILGEGRPLANASEVDGAVQCWAKDAAKAARMDRRDEAARRRRQTHQDSVDAIAWGLLHRPAPTPFSDLPGFPAGRHLSLSGRSNPLGMLLGIANVVAGTNAMRQMVRDQDLPASLLDGLPERAGPGRRDVMVDLQGLPWPPPRRPIDPRVLVICRDEDDARKAFREAVKAGEIQAVQPTSTAHQAFLEAGGRCSVGYDLAEPDAGTIVQRSSEDTNDR